MTGHCARRKTRFLDRDPEGRDRRREQAGLSVLRQRQIALGTVKAELLQVFLHGFRSFFKNLTRHLKVIVKVLGHSDMLGALAGTKKTEAHGYKWADGGNKDSGTSGRDLLRIFPLLLISCRVPDFRCNLARVEALAS